MKKSTDITNRLRKVRVFIGWLGLLIATPFFIWGLLGLLGLVPSMLQVFGISGIRIPASITIIGLLVAAIGFWDYD
ncbi:hypothetical protein [Microbulbifer sp. GL-2]|uniref:hypothetical protein n=1 Tax=Microbulbifer sp. GL-2 TaxID=2591606 RepID=UPI00117DDE44|nr:hypothetical protein [Microbulbifer sp. GL-2]